MCPDSTTDHVFLFDANDGTLFDDNFIDGSGILNTPINAITVGDETWISPPEVPICFSLPGVPAFRVGDA